MDKSTSNDELIILRDICPTDESLSLLESVDTPKGEYTGVVLASLDGPVMDYKVPTRNERLYEEELCDEIAESEYVAELIETKNFLGEPDHPMRYENRLDIHYPNVSHAIRNLRKVPNKGCYYATFDILDTPNGRILKTLIDYGTKLGVSSRGSGRTITKMGKVVVDKSTYRFITFDIVCMPGNKVARLPITNESVEENSASMTLTEQVDSFIESNDVESLRSIKSVLNFLSESQEIKDLINRVDAKLEEDESNTNTESDTTDLVDAYATIKDLRSQLATKDSVIKDQSSQLESLRASLTDLQNTYSDVNSKLSKSSSLAMTHLRKEQDARRKLSSVQSELEESNKSRDQLLVKLNAKKKEVSERDAQVKKLTENVSSVASAKDKRIEELESDNAQAERDLDSLAEQLEFSTKRYDELASKYLLTRCSQLGLDESMLRKSLSEDFSSYSHADLERILQEAYKRKPSLRRSQGLFESLGQSAKVGATVVTANKSTKFVSGNADDSLLVLTESCRAVRNQ